MAFSFIAPLFTSGSFVKNKNNAVTCVYTNGERPAMYGSVKEGAKLIRLDAGTQFIVSDCYTVAMDDPQTKSEICFYAYELLIHDPLKVLGTMRVSLMETDLISVKPEKEKETATIKAKVLNKGIDKAKLAKERMTQALPDDFPEVGGKKKENKDSEPPRSIAVKEKTYKHANILKRVETLLYRYEDEDINGGALISKLLKYERELQNTKNQIGDYRAQEHKELSIILHNANLAQPNKIEALRKLVRM